MNGTSLLRATHLVAARSLRNNPMEVSLLVCDGYDPREVVRMKLEQERLSSSNVSAAIDSTSLSSEGTVHVHMYIHVHVHVLCIGGCKVCYPATLHMYMYIP